MSEAEVQKQIRLEASRRGWRLWRNNVGVAFTSKGVPVRYGLANESKQVNTNIKSSDLIGIIPTIITPQHVGHTVGVFASIECKHENWTYSNTAHEQAQWAWIRLINSLGGHAKFVNSLGDL